MESFFASRWFDVHPSSVRTTTEKTLKARAIGSARSRRRGGPRASSRDANARCGRRGRARRRRHRGRRRAREGTSPRGEAPSREKKQSPPRGGEKKPASRRRASGTTNDGVRGVARGRATTASRRASRRRRRRPRVDGRAASSPRSPRPTTRLRRGQGFSLIAGRAARSPGNRRDATTRATRDVATRAMRRTGASATRTALGHLVLAVWKRRVRCPERASARMRRELRLDDEEVSEYE